MVTPVGRVRTFPLLQFRDCIPGHTGPERKIVEERQAPFLPVGTPGDDRRQVGPTDGAKDIRIDDRPITERDSNVAFKDNIAGERECSFFLDKAFRENGRARFEARITGFRDVDGCRFTKEDLDPPIPISSFVLHICMTSRSSSAF
jgi:hypothetical protein